MKRLLNTGLAILLTLGSGSATAAGPSFDCTRAAGQVETLICNDAELAALDRKLAAAYDRALERVAQDGYEDPHAMQRGWIKAISVNFHTI